MARRSSARLRDRNSTTPKRVSLSHDEPGRTPKTLPVKLSALHEHDEVPGAFPDSESPPQMLSRAYDKPVSQSSITPETPTHTARAKAATEEMHPHRHQQTTAKPLDEARHLGFSSMAPHTEPAKHSSRLAILQATPTKSRDLESETKSPRYHFTFRREHSLELSPDAKKLMLEKREEAAKIRQQMIADGEGVETSGNQTQRKIALPKGKSKRFSQVHSEHFAKMDSIADHASAFRADPNRPTSSHCKTSDPMDTMQASAKKSLKRSPSKAGLDGHDQAHTRPVIQSAAKPFSASHGSNLLRSTSFKDLKYAAAEQSSPDKRIKRAENEDVSATRHESSTDETDEPTTPQHKTVKTKSSQINLAYLTTPTQSSLARAASVKSAQTTKIPAPALTPAKRIAEPQKNQSAQKQETTRASGLFGTPAKFNFPSLPKHNVNSEDGESSTPLLARSPSKVSLFAKPSAETPSTMADTLLSRSPCKPVIKEKTTLDNTKDADASKSQAPPLLARSPLKAPAVTTRDQDAPKEKSSAIPFLSRSPSKFNLAQSVSEAASTPGKSESKLMSRFNLLRKSPIKSILRTPQRLYSDDPAKVAAGTHFATPPKHSPAVESKSQSIVKATAPASLPAQKHVDFTSSTKAREMEVQEAKSRTPSKSPTPIKSVRSIAGSVESGNVAYPDLSAAALSPSPAKRRQTVGPGDFTFRVGSNIVFSQSPNAPASAAQRPSTIRHVSSHAALPPPPPTGSKKRKFEFENDIAASADEACSTSDKENDFVSTAAEDDQRPAKRVKQSAPAPSPTKSPVKTATRPSTLGVKPKKGPKDSQKRPTTISRARLAALSQPKRRT